MGGGGDQACAAVGNGITDQGIVGYSVGTSGGIYAATDEVKDRRRGRVDTFCHAVPGRWALLGVTNSAAASLAWFQQSFAAHERLEAERQKRSVFSILEELASQVPAGSDRLFFLPYLGGSGIRIRTPTPGERSSACIPGTAWLTPPAPSWKGWLTAFGTAWKS